MNARIARATGPVLVALATGFGGTFVAGCGGGKGHEARSTWIKANPDRGPVTGNTYTALQVAGIAATGSLTVTFNGVPATVVQVTERSIIVNTPPGSGLGPVAVKVTSDLGGEVEWPNVFTYEAASTSSSTTPGSTPGTTPGTPGTTPTPGAGNFAFIPGTDKWFVVTDDLSMCDADQDGTPDLEQVLQFARDDRGGQGAYSGRLIETTDAIMSLACQYYGNNPDGTLRQGGIKMSFQRTAPTVGASPPRGTQDPPTGVNDFNLMAWQHLGGSSATTGRGLLDNGGDNAQLENNSGRNGSTGNELGCFPDRMVDFWNRSGISTSQRSLSNFCLGLAGTMAHECGHSIGLNHTSAAPRSPATVNVMAASSVVDPAELYGFDQTTYSFMLGFMPGANRCMHPAGFTPRWLVQEARAVVVATPRTLQDGRLTLDVHAVLAGDLEAGAEATIAGFTEGAALDRAALASVGRSIWFLSAGTEGYRFEGGEAEVLPLAGRDEAEWTALIVDHLRLQALAKTDRAAWTAEYAALLGRSLTSQDARIRGAALVELSLEAAATKALSKDAALALAGIAGSADALEGQRLFALQALTHRADPALVGQVLAAGLSTDVARLQAAAAGALEQTLGLEGGATKVLAALETAPASKARALVLLGWLQAKGAVGLLTGELASANAVAAADALGRIGDASALDALQAVAVDADRDQATRDHALRAIGRIGGEQAKAFLTAQGTESARFARDFAATWLLE